MNKIIKALIGSIIAIILILMIISQLLFNDPMSLIYIPIWIVETRKGIDEQYNKAKMKEEANREDNRMAAEKWLIDTYGKEIAEVTTIEFSNRSGGWGTDSVFHMESPFASGSIFVDSDTKEVDGGFNLEGIKFQHLYSEWVKKQVGIEDENVEFGFTGIFDKPYIEFDKITTLSEDYREIFENTHKLYAWLCEIRNIKNLNENNVYQIAEESRKQYLLKAISVTNFPVNNYFSGRLYLSTGNNARERGNSFVIDFDINSATDCSSQIKYRFLE